MAADPHTMFERALMDSARGDAEPRDVGAAWSRFVVALDRAAVGRGDEPPGAAAPPAGPPAAPSRRILSWLLVGALGGAGATIAVSRRGPAIAPPAGTADPGPPGQGEPPAGEAPPAITRPVVDDVPDRARPMVRRHAARQSAESWPSGSALAAEVLRVDAARSANARGEHDEAIRLVEDYHARFPAGALAADADLVALEAAAANHDRAEVTRRASLFLSRHPRDPHAARVRRIAAQAGAGPRRGDR